METPCISDTFSMKECIRYKEDGKKEMLKYYMVSITFTPLIESLYV